MHLVTWLILRTMSVPDTHAMDAPEWLVMFQVTRPEGPAVPGDVVAMVAEKRARFEVTTGAGSLFMVTDVSFVSWPGRVGPTEGEYAGSRAGLRSWREAPVKIESRQHAVC